MNESEAWLKILDEWKQVDRARRLNQRLYDILASSLIYLLEYSKKYDFILPHKDRLNKMIEESEKIMDEISPPNFKHPNGTPREKTEPKIIKNINETWIFCEIMKLI